MQFYGAPNGGLPIAGVGKSTSHDGTSAYSTRHEEESRYPFVAYHHQNMDIDALPAPITTADAPFDDLADNADLVIRTDDNVDFFVLSALLSLGSPSSFFHQVLQGNKHTEERDGLPVLRVEEDSDTFRDILLFCYPYATPKIGSIEQFMEVGMALNKYCMDLATERFIQTVLVSSVISEQPFRVFALAVANGWKEIGEAAARNTLSMPLNQVVSDIEELGVISARHRYRLQDYHVRCGKAAQIRAGMGVSLPWLDQKTSGLTFLRRDSVCPWCCSGIRFVAYGDSGERLYSHGWLVDTYFQLVNAKLLLEPWPQVALDDHIIDQTIVASNKQCGAHWNSIAGSQILRLGKIVAEEIDRRISKSSPQCRVE
ncbi:uncharacterized protein EV420DRAFT_552502 [Desarmillaria tabescens]|uniref:BTB domain-containing protein n=1 Tax=Armillaria tabescens TaxID=1929756 RepID=A0AA39K751_ARMTA|nr:uncharacterized protein EV420DRAFT_552502 [Desarmillaria tabescens]KAK0455607.1 hypothetical protein EV420DRAFT_552502 [Desarmillaria tabescens]